MRITYAVYKNSPLSTLLSLISQLLLFPAGGVILLLSIISINSIDLIWVVAVVSGIIIIALAFFLHNFAENYSHFLAFKSMMALPENAVPDDLLNTSLETAVQLYIKFPKIFTVWYIRSKNPDSAKYIRKNKKMLKNATLILKK